MPDFVRSTVIIEEKPETPKGVLDECHALLTDEFDLNQIIPQPAVFNKIAAGGRWFTGPGYVRIWIIDEGYPDGCRYLSDEEEADLIARYDTNNWYEWCITNWGAKWNTSEVSCVRTDGWLEYTFETPWEPPTNAVEELRNLFPELRIYASITVEEAY